MSRVAEILAHKGRDVYTIDHGATVLAAVEKLVDKNVGALVVTDGEATVGIFTERDFLRRVALRQRDPRTTRVRLVGDATTAEVEVVLDALWGGPETLVVVSSDLSHYLPYRDARTRDRATAEAILDTRADLTGEDACGCTAVNGLLRVARRRGLRVALLDLRNSGDTAGDRERVVGYGAFGLYDA